MEAEMAESCITPTIRDNREGEIFYTIPTPRLHPLEPPEKAEFCESSRQERVRFARRQTLARFRQRLKDSGLPGSDYLLAFLGDKYRQGRSANTIRASGSAVLSFLAFLDSQECSLAALNKADLSAYVEAEQDRGLKIVSVNSKTRILYQFLSYLTTRQVVSPAILKHRIRMRIPDPLPRALSSEDLELLLSVLDDIRDRAMVLLLLRSGMRIGELLELTIMDIDLVERKIMIYIGEKNHEGRVVYFSDDAKEALEKWLVVRDPAKKYLFYGRRNTPLSYAAAWLRITACFKKAGLSHKPYNPHCLRHTFATEVLNAGMRLEVVQQLLGHRNIEMTRRYARLSDTTREEEYFAAMARIEQGGVDDGNDRFNDKLQAVFEKKKLLSAHD